VRIPNRRTLREINDCKIHLFKVKEQIIANNIIINKIHVIILRKLSFYRQRNTKVITRTFLSKGINANSSVLGKYERF